ncbi:hypothetical protein AB0K04_21005 [Micromonospora coxensis]|uniref:hypothetical protein n=1 Tax=Micromonospora coxensis TaxID=356852 RepID=UPI0034487C8A
MPFTTTRIAAAHLAVLIALPLAGCTSREPRGAYALGGDICTSEIVALAGIPAGEPRRETGEEEGRPTQSCTFGVRVGGTRGRDDAVSITATRHEDGASAAESYRRWHDSDTSVAAGVHDLGTVSTGVGAFRSVHEHQVAIQDDNLLVRVSWPDHEAGGPPDVATRLRTVGEAALSALRRSAPPSPPTRRDGESTPDPVLDPSTQAPTHTVVADLCAVLDLSALSPAKPSDVRRSTLKPDRLRGVTCSVTFPPAGGRESQLLASAAVPVDGDGATKIARMYAFERHRRPTQTRDVAGLASATFVQTQAPTMTTLLAYDGNLRLELLWLSSGDEDAADLQRRLVAVADSAVARL